MGEEPTKNAFPLHQTASGLSWTRLRILFPQCFSTSIDSNVLPTWISMSIGVYAGTCTFRFFNSVLEERWIDRESFRLVPPQKPGLRKKSYWLRWVGECMKTLVSRAYTLTTQERARMAISYLAEGPQAT